MELKSKRCKESASYFFLFYRDTGKIEKDLTAKHENIFDKPRGFAPEAPRVQKLVNEIVAFEMRIEKLEGKFKLNQNRKPEDRAGVIETLSASDDPVHRVVAEWMTRTS